MKKPLIVLTGPTAVGKTDLSISLAKKINGEIISADSMQVYKNMDIGTAKIKKEEMEGIKHYLVDEFEPDEEFNINIFQQRSKKYMGEIYNIDKVPMLVGGTGFYIQSILYDIDFTKSLEDNEYRKRLSAIGELKGNAYLHSLLRKVDSQSADNIHPNNVKRVIRALEYFFQTKSPISVHNKEQSEKQSPYNYIYFVLNMDREKLYERINQRIDIMMDEGLVEEVKNLKDMGYSRELVSMKGLGYKEIIEYLEGECTLDQAVYKLKRDTRHFAKRQLTWFRREKNVTWINVDEFNGKKEILEHMLKMIEDKQIMI